MSKFFFFLLFGLAVRFIVPTICLATSPDTYQVRDIPQKSQSRLFQNEITVVFPKPNFWEIPRQGVFQNRGIAQIDKLGKEYVLTVSCNGVHRVFIHQHKKINLEEFLGQFVQARYTYGDVRKRVQCIKKPCNPITERKLIIHDLEKVVGSEQIRAQFETTCTP